MNKDVRNAQLNDLYKFQYGKGNTIEDIGGDYPIYGSNGPVGYTNIYNSENAPVIGHIGAYAGIVNWASGKHYVTYNGVICRIKKGINNRFGYYTLLVSNLRNRLRGSTQPFVSYDLLNDVKVYLPDREIQDNIAKILSDLDYKIEVNNKINQELEAMAKTLYDYWFVQFDFPDQNGKPYKSSGGKMVYNKELKREIPEGWEVKEVIKEMDVQYGFPFSTKLFNEDKKEIPVIRIRDILNNTISVYTTEVVDIKYKLEKNDLLIGMDGNFHMNFWDKEGCYLNQRSVRIRQKENKSVSTFQAFFDTQPYIKAREKNVSRTTVGHLSARDINDLKVLHPQENIRKQSNNFFNKILDKIIINRNENQKLAELRDWLLPMLMNGQVTFGEAKAQLGMVAEEGETYKLK